MVAIFLRMNNDNKKPSSSVKWLMSSSAFSYLVFLR
jgi:hypothetical protein